MRGRDIEGSVIERTDIERAHARIAPHVRRTPMLALSDATFGRALSLKLELLQHAGSFKPRGAFNKVLSSEVPPAGLIAASGGNHGVAVAHVARRLGHRAEIFVPEIVTAPKLARLRAEGPAVTITGATYADALAASSVRAAETGALVVHAYDQPEVVAGQGTVGKEIEEDAPPVDTVLVACGGGGLVAGIAAWYTRRVKVVAVEPEGCPALARALEAGRPVDAPVGGLCADSLGARSVGDLAFAIAREHVARVALVRDEDVAAAQGALFRELRLVAEPGGAAALAAVLAGAYAPAPGERVCVVVCGSNADPAKIAGLAAS